MVTKKDIEKIIKWCDQKKKERNRTYVIERNPFSEEIRWTSRFALIEIDRPKEIAAKTSIVYDSTIRVLWHYLNNEWRRIESDITSD